MLRTLQIEWMKVKNYRTFWILLAITVISIPGVNYTVYNLMKNSLPTIKGKSILGNPFAFPDIWQTVAFNGSLILLVPAILVITLTTNEFVYKTHRQNIIDGWSRRRFVTVKLVEVLLLSVFCTLVMVLTVLAAGYIASHPEPGVSAWQGIHFAFFYFIQTLSWLLIAFMMSMLIKRAGLVIGVWLVYALMENVLVFRFKKSVIVEYLPEEVTDRLIPQPFVKAIRSPEQVAYWESHVPVYLTVAFLYIAIYCLVTSRRFIKSDL